MKKIIASLMVFVFAAIGVASITNHAEAKTSVGGYTKRNGAYVAPHYRSDRDSSKSNNWSSKGNTNPYTGKKGYK